MKERDLVLKGREPRELLIEISALIEEARHQTAVAVNMGLRSYIGVSASVSVWKCCAASALPTANRLS